MMQDRTQGRRSFLSRIAAGAGAFGAAFATSSAIEAQAQTPAGAPFQALRHAEDDWLDQTPGAKHRFFYDTTTTEGAAQALFFARNYFVASASGYKLADADVAQVICLRHASASFAFTDAMWAKYGAYLAERADHFVDPKTKQVPTTNLLLATGYGELMRNVNVTLDQMSKRGVRYAVCGMATRAAAQLAATKSGGNVDAIFKELSENLVAGGHLVPAGIVSVSHAQERGYSFVYVV